MARLVAEVLGLLAVEIVKTVAVYMMLPAREILGLQWAAVVSKRGRFGRVCQQLIRRRTPRCAEFEKEANDVAALVS